MTVQLITSYKKYIGLSTDTKPTSVVGIGHGFYETDTGYNFIWDGVNWVEDLSLMVAVKDALAE